MKRVLLMICFCVALFAPGAIAHEEHPEQPPKRESNRAAAGIAVAAILVAGGAGIFIYRVIRKGL